MNEFVDIDKMILLTPLTDGERNTYITISNLISINKDLTSNQTEAVKNTISGLVDCIKNNDTRRNIYENCIVPEYKLLIIIEDLSRVIRDINDSLEMYQDTDDKKEKKDWLETAKKYIADLSYNLQVYRQITSSPEEEKEPPKHLLFLQTKAGNYYFEKDIKDIPEDYYNDFVELLKKMHNGEETNNESKDRMLGNNNKQLRGLWEKKDYKVRIQYLKLPKNTYLIVMVQMKEDRLDDLEERYNKVETRAQIKIIREIIQANGDAYQFLIDDGEEKYQDFIGEIKEQARKRNKK